MSVGATSHGSNGLALDGGAQHAAGDEPGRAAGADEECGATLSVRRGGSCNLTRGLS